METGEVKFHIVERSSTEVFGIYPKIKQDILDGVKIKNIREKYDIPTGQWAKFRKKLIEDGIIKSREQSRKDSKFYYYNSHDNRYFVVKTINKKKVWFGKYVREEDAINVVAKLKEYGWDKSKMPRILRELGI